MSLLLSLLLAAPAQVLPAQQPLTPADALAYFPADTMAVVQLDPGPWKEHGAGTRAHELFAHEGFQAFLAQFPVPEDVPTLLANYRVTAGIGYQDLLIGRFLLVLDPVGDAPALDPHHFGDYPKQGLKDGLVVHGSEHEGSWCRDGDRVLLLPSFPGLGHEAPSFERDVAWLAARVNASRGQVGHAGALASLAGLRERVESDQDLFRFYVPFDEWRLANFGFLLGFTEDDMPFSIQEMLAPFGMDKIESLGWVMAVEGRMLRDRIMISGEEPMARLYAGAYSPDGDVLARFEQLPGDATMATISRFNLTGLLEGIEEMLDLIFGSFGGDWEANEFSGWMETGKRIAATMGDEVVGVQRAEDLWQRRNGALWFTLADPAAFQSALDELPPEVHAMLAQGIDAGPGNYRFGLKVEGDRAYVAFSAAEEEAGGALAENKPYRELRPWIEARIREGDVNGMGYVGPEVAAEGFDAMRRDGIPPEFAQMLPIELDFSTLPDFDFVVNRIGGTATVSRGLPDGLLLETLSPLGYLGTMLANPAIFDAILQGMSGQTPFGGNAYDSDVFDDEF